MLQEKFRSIANQIPVERKLFPDYLNKLAEFVFLKLNLKNADENFRICEIEFYIWSNDHPDLFTHKVDQQLEFGRWYFHPSGLDITFGDKNTYASFLIRGIKREDPGKREEYISGPLNVMQTLCNSSQTIDHSTPVINALYSDDIQETKWIKHERIGLNKEKELQFREMNGDQSKNDLYYNKPYRYISELLPKHGFKNRTKVLEDNYRPGKNREMIKNAFSYTPKFLNE